MDYRKQFTRKSSLIVYASLVFMLVGKYAVGSGSVRYAVMTAGTALLAGATMCVLLDVRKREAQMCAVRKNKVAN